MPPGIGEPTIQAGERPQTHALDRAAIGIGSTYLTFSKSHLFIELFLFPENCSTTLR